MCGLGGNWVTRNWPGKWMEVSKINRISFPFTQSTTHIRTHCRGGLLFAPTCFCKICLEFRLFPQGTVWKDSNVQAISPFYQATAYANAGHCEILKIKPGCIRTKRLSRFAFCRDLTVDCLISLLDMGNTWKKAVFESPKTKTMCHVHTFAHNLQLGIHTSKVQLSFLGQQTCPSSKALFNCMALEGSKRTQVSEKWRPLGLHGPPACALASPEQGILAVSDEKDCLNPRSLQWLTDHLQDLTFITHLLRPKVVKAAWYLQGPSVPRVLWLAVLKWHVQKK